jgi:hypothetical protein
MTTNRRDSGTTGIPVPDGIIGIERQEGVALSGTTSDRRLEEWRQIERR